MVHHATSTRNEVGQAFLPVLLPVALQSFEQQFKIFHNGKSIPVTQAKRVNSDRQECLSYFALTLLLGENDLQ